jgi:hypothetical protein
MATLQATEAGMTRRRPRTAHADRSTSSSHIDSLSAPTSERRRRQQDSSFHTSELMHRPKTAPALSEEFHKVRDLEKQNSNFRSARYLALQWRSRSAQWSATSSMRSSKTSSSLLSSPPPPLKEYGSDSESSFENASVDESVVSQVSEAYKVLEAWKSRSSSLSVGHQSSFYSDSEDDNADDTDNDKHAIENQEMMGEDPDISNEDDGDEFGMVDSFAFAFAQRGEKKFQNTGSPKQMFSSHIQNNSQNLESKNARNGNVTITPPLDSVTESVGSDEQDEILRRLNYTPDPSRPSTYKKLLQNQLEQARSKAIQSRVAKNPLESKDEPKYIQGPSKTNSSCANSNNNSNKVTPHVGNPDVVPFTKETIKIVWDVFDFVFTFSLLTNQQKAPPIGDYVPDDKCHAFKDKLRFKSKLLHDILQLFSQMLGQLPSLAKEREGRKFMMLSSDCIPILKHVRRDGK